jgi:hypothetical protein
VRRRCLSWLARHSGLSILAVKLVSCRFGVERSQISAYRIGLDFGKEGAHGDGDLKSILPVCSWPNSGEVTPAWRQARDVELRTDDDDSVIPVKMSIVGHSPR